jgi:hypothetical protein
VNVVNIVNVARWMGSSTKSSVGASRIVATVRSMLSDLAPADTPRLLPFGVGEVRVRMWLGDAAVCGRLPKKQQFPVLWIAAP